MIPSQSIAADTAFEEGMLTVRIPIGALNIPVQAAAPVDIDAVQFAQFILRSREIRSANIPGVDLGEPTWNILLDLFVSQAIGRRTSVTHACIAAGVPATTGLRHLERLVAQGHVLRYEDSTDRRRVFVALSQAMQDRIEALMTRTVAALRTLLTSPMPRPFKA